jgi:hypothetical protein
MMIRAWANIANKLGITQESALLLHALLRGWLNVIARRQAYIVVSDLVERFDLDDTEYAVSYAEQLLAKGILNPTEAGIFAGNFYEDNSGPTAGAGGAASEGGAAAPTDSSGPDAA